MAPPKSQVWRHFIKDGQGGRCKQCHKLVATASNTTNLWIHLERSHGIRRSKQTPTSTGNRPSGDGGEQDPDDPSEVPETSQQRQRPSSAAGATGHGHAVAPTTPTASALSSTERWDNAVGTSSNKRMRPQTLEDTMARADSFSETGHRTAELNNSLMFMVCKDNLPLSTPDHEGFKKFVKTAVPLYTLPSRRTLTRMMEQKYTILKEKIEKSLESVETFTLTSDLWTEVHTSKSYLGITVHYVSGNEIRSATIGVSPLEESHTAVYIEEMIRETLQKWKIPLEKVAVMVTDNGANIVAAARTLFGRNKHVPCYAHTLNLVLTQSFQLTPGLDALIGRVKGIVTYFRQSRTASDELRKLQLANGRTEGTLLKLVQEVDTRWNSRFDMVDRFIEMSDMIAAVLLKLGNTGHDMLTGGELSALKEIRRLLKPMASATQEMSAEKYTTISKIITHLMRQMVSSMELSPNAVVQSLKKHLVEQLDKRFGMVERVHMFAIATILDPRYKRLHFQSALGASEAITAISSQVSARIRANSPAAAEPETAANRDPNPDDLWSLHDQLVAATPPAQPDAPGGIPVELRQYLNKPVIRRDEDPIATWRKMTVEYPHLSQVALHYLSLIATSVPAERLFSKAGQTVGTLRTRLTGERLSQLLFLGSLGADEWFS